MSTSEQSHRAERDPRLKLYPILQRALRATREGQLLDGALFDQLIERTRPAVSVEEGEVLFRMGDPAATVFVVQAGILKGEVTDSSGRSQVADFHLSGDFVDIQSFCTLRRETTVSAITTSRVVAIDLHGLLELARGDAVLQDALHRAVGRELLKLDHLIFLVGRKTVAARIAAFYLDLAQRLAALGNSPTRLYFPALRADIASHLMMDPATFTRGFRQLEREALLSGEGADITLLDTMGLKRLAGDIPPPVDGDA